MSIIIKFSVFIPSFLILINDSPSSATPFFGDNVVAAGEKEFPFVVSVGLDVRGRGHFCTGSLISSRHVLTAAHCFSKVGRARNVKVRIGTNDLRSGTLHRIDGWITYDQWAKDDRVKSAYTWNDIAVITLSREVEDIPFGRLSTEEDRQNYGKTAVTVGWGAMKNNDKPNVLQKTSVRVMSKAECEKNTKDLGMHLDQVQLNELCTNAKPPVILGCGDSGGPLLINGKIVGVNEGICPEGAEQPLTYNLHASVVYFRRFIDEAMKLKDLLA